jgi:conjugative relaxase-like TrwC/TraI family protein
VSGSLHTGYDTGYLTDAVGKGRTGADYYTGEAGEPPGYWQGRGAAALGLSGEIGGQDEAGKASAAVMRRLYHEDIGPDGQVLARRQRPGRYQSADGSLYGLIEAEVQREVAARGRFIQPEEIRQIRLKVRARLGRNRVPFYDYTYSAPKSVSVLWASLLQAAAEAAAEGREAESERLTERAEQVRGAVKRASDRIMAVAERELAYVRTGHHSATSGEWRDADGFIIASFPQHTNRDGDPQLHVHNAIANRAQRADKAASGDEKWRALHGHPLFRNKLRLSVLGDRFLGQELEQLEWLRMVRRADGKAIEVGGISEEAVETFSARVREVQAMARELALKYEEKHGHAPGKRAWFLIKQEAAKKTRDVKDHNPPKGAEEVTAWARKAKRSEIDLGSLHEAATAYAAEHPPSSVPSEAERARIIRKAVAAVQTVNATWDRSQLTFELDQVVPPLPAGVDPEAYFAELAEEAVSGRAEGVNVLQVAPVADVIDVSRLGGRKDGGSIYRPPGEERFCTAEHRDTEAWLVDAAGIPVPRRVTDETAAVALAGTDLDYSQREACLGLLTSGRLINCLVAPAGTGKTHVMAEYARVWREEGRGRVIGLAASENAARVMAGEGLDTAVNIARFLGKIKDSDATRGHMPVYPGDVLVVDEATQVSTADAARIVQIARQSGAQVVAAFDPEQLGAVDAGGIFPLIAAKHGSYRLAEVRRFRNAWERDASLRLREGEIEALTEYAGRGHVYHGPRDRVHDDAVMLWVSDYLRNHDTLLLAASNEEAAELARLARERLIELKRISGADEITLADGNHAGTGDLVRARLNTRIEADGQTLANRDTIRIDGWHQGAFERLARVSRRIRPGEWSRPFFVPAAYLEQNAELDYAGNIHVAQGRTVGKAHLVVSEGMNRSQFYVGMTRGREENTIHVVTGPPDPAQPTRAEREAYTAEAIDRAAALRKAGDAAGAKAVPLRMPDRPSGLQLAPWEAVLAQVMQRDDPERTALEEIQAAQDYTRNIGHLLQLQEAFWRLDVVPQIDEMVRQRIPAAEYERYLTDPARPAFLEALREHEIGGRRIEDVLDSITAEPLDGLRSIAAGLHGRAGKEPAPERGKTAGWAERAPRAASAEIAAAGAMMDTRQAELGRQLAARPPRWALERWGDPRGKSPALLADWQRRAGIVAAYREAAGVTAEEYPIGPPPSGSTQVREAFLAAVTALALPDDAALLKAMGQGELEAIVDEYDRAAAAALPDVQAEVGERHDEARYARARADIALGAGNPDAAADAERQAEEHAGELARLTVADAARQEWLEANDGKQAAAAEQELRQRGLAPRIPVTDAEVAAASAAGRETPAMDPAEWARIKAEQTAQYEAERQARIDAAARACPVTDTEIEQYGGGLEPEISPEAARELAELMQAGRDALAEAERTAQAETLAQRFPVTDAEVAAASARPRDYPAPDPAEVARWRQEQAEQAAQARERGRTIEPGPEAERETPHVDPGAWAAQKAAQTEEVDADRKARAEASARLTPVTDAEVERYGASAEPEAADAGQDRAAALGEIRTEVGELGAKVDEMARQDAERAAERAAIAQAAIDEPSVREPQAEPSLEPSWQPGSAQGQYQPTAGHDAEPEMEMG